MGFFTTEVLAELVPAWLLVKRALEVEVLGRGRSLQTRVPPKRRCFSCGYFSGSLASLAGAAAWLGVGGSSGASGGMFARPLPFGGMALRCPRNDLSGAKEPW